MSSIQVFAIDSYKRNGMWKLPFIRVGTTKNHDSAVSCTDGIERFGCPLSEGHAIWWVYEHLSDFGSPEYVGICQYRRFFGPQSISHLIPVYGDLNDSSLCLTPNQQLDIVQQSNIDMLIPYLMNENFTSHDHSSYTYIWESAYKQGVEDKTGLSLKQYEIAFKSLFDYSPAELKPFVEDSFKEKQMYFCSIFTMRRQLFEVITRPVFHAVCDCLSACDENSLFKLNCRSGGYVIERLYSTMLHALVKSGCRFKNLPLVVTNFATQPTYRNMTTADCNMLCDIDGLKKEIIV